MRNICICGGGSLGLVSSGVMACKGLNGSLLTIHTQEFDESRNLKIIDINGKICSGILTKISSDLWDLIT